MKQKNMNGGFEIHIRNTSDSNPRNRKKYVTYILALMGILLCMLYGDYPPPTMSMAETHQTSLPIVSQQPEVSDKEEIKKGEEEFVSTFAMTYTNKGRIIGDKDFDIAKKKKDKSSGIKTQKSTPIKYRYKCSDTEYKVLLNIVEAEVTGDNPKGVGYEKAVECKLHVAQVILNRLEDDEFPNNIVDIVFAKKQFSPTEDGRYGTLEISDATIEAVEKALNAKTPDTTGGALYFAVPELTWNGLQYIKTDAVGHRLYRDISKD